MRILITGSDGFIGRNLQQHLSERSDVAVRAFTRRNSPDELLGLVQDTDWIFHLAGVNRTKDPTEFTVGNADLTRALCNAVRACGKKVSVVFTSSTQAGLANPYGCSKHAAEDALFALHQDTGYPVHMFRLGNVFGKWARPNYNSAVATFCHNMARGLPIRVHDAAAPLTLLYIDDVVKRFLQLLDGADPQADQDGFVSVAPQYSTTVGTVAELIRSFAASRTSLTTSRVGTGLERALYATYMSYLPMDSFAYSVPMHKDARGLFVEMLKTPDCGQFSFFTAHPGITRGGHYHHTKTEKFLVIKGRARFGFRHIQTGQVHELMTSGDRAEIVETVPGWTHDITNVGKEELVVMLWANEIFDPKQPDTIACPV